MTFTLRKDIIMHDSFKVALSKLEAIHKRSKENGFAEGFIITAPAGAGKTTLINYYVERFPPVEREDRTTIPVLVVETPAAPTAKSLVETIQIALSGTIVKGSTEFQTKRIYTLLKEQKVELLIIDEIQHFVDRRHAAETVKVTDWLKSFINRAKIPVVIFGLHRGLQILELNEQLRRRFSARYFMRPFDFSDADQQKGFRAVLKSMGDGLPFACKPSIHDFNLAKRFHYASNGLFDYIVKIIDAAVEYAEKHNLVEMNQGVFAEAFKDSVWNDAPDELNPFMPQFVLRRLDQTGEPFAPSEFDKVERGTKPPKAA
jgi:hypothetical protein